MNRRSFLKHSGAAALLPLAPRPLFAKAPFRRRRPADPDWPSPAAWKKLNEAVGGNLIPVEFPLNACNSGPDAPGCRTLFENLRNPYFIGDQPSVTQTLGWMDAWATKPSIYAVAARNAQDIAVAVNFARENNLRLVVKGGGHSYQGTSNAPDSLLVWTRHMQDVSMHTDFVPQGCAGKLAPQPAVTVGSGTIWMQAYNAVTTQGAAYVQGGGCTTVGVAGLVQSGGFGSFSKHYGTAAAGLLEAEVITADGKIRIANACTHSDLFWALKGGGGGSFGVISKLTLRVRDLPEFWGAAIFRVKASSDDTFRRLLRQFVGFYRDNLFNDHWGEQVHVNGDNTLEFSFVSHDLTTDQAKKIWQPFLDWLAASPGAYTIEAPPIIGSMPARHWWDVDWRKEHKHPVFKSDSRPDASPNNVWWNGDGGQVGWFIYAFESLWMPATLLDDDSQEGLANALFAASRHSDVELHFNKGLAGAPADAIEAAKNTAMNPAVVTAFALAIVADGQRPAYPGLPGHEPDVARGKNAAENVHLCMKELREVASGGGAYVSESNYFERDWQHAYWGSNHDRLAAVKKKYDPSGLFFVHNGVGSEQWSADGFTKL
ncbi:MAG TPA: FAD-dependent oxidoreductase [Candidatus Sulfotelmatobacter sp.]|nr:FAD-dependent oxidoreductase [Candidatus Sulfotelmatobacter sp.]